MQQIVGNKINVCLTYVQEIETQINIYLHVKPSCSNYGEYMDALRSEINYDYLFRQNGTHIFLQNIKNGQLDTYQTIINQTTHQLKNNHQGIWDRNKRQQTIYETYYKDSDKLTKRLNDGYLDTKSMDSKISNVKAMGGKKPVKKTTTKKSTTTKKPVKKPVKKTTTKKSTTTKKPVKKPIKKTTTKKSTTTKKPVKKPVKKTTTKKSTTTKKPVRKPVKKTTTKKSTTKK